jgi:hypothetical protein
VVPQTVRAFLWQYKYVFLFVLAVWGAGVALYAYFADVLTDERTYTVQELREG